MDRKLIVRKESLAGLTPDELSQVDGAAEWTPWCPFILEVTEKLNRVLSAAACLP